MKITVGHLQKIAENFTTQIDHSRVSQVTDPEFQIFAGHLHLG